MATPPSPQDAWTHPGVQRVSLAAASEAFPRHSEPTFIERRDGTLLVAWQEFLGSAHRAEDTAPSRIALMESHDEGRSWHSHRVIVETEPGDVNVYSPNFFRVGGTIFLLVMTYHQLEGGKPLVSSLRRYRSRDEGQTFEADGWVWQRESYQIASGVARVLPSGRILLPFVRQCGVMWGPGDHLDASCFYSDDGGESWQRIGQWLKLPMRGAMEPHVAAAGPGRVAMVMRNQLGSVFAAFSGDDGLIWSLPQTTGLSAPESCPELVNDPRTGDLILIWNHAPYDPGFTSHFGKRTPLSLARSHDGGRTWEKVADLRNEPEGCYSNPVAFVTSRGRWIVAYFYTHYLVNGRMDVSGISLQAVVFDADFWQ